MNKSFYTSVIFFLGISIPIALLQSILYLLVGGQIFTMSAFMGWFLIMQVVGLASSCLTLWYFYSRKYYSVFFAGIVATLAAMVQGIVFFTIINTATLQNLYIPVVFVVLASGILYALVLIFSAAKERFWLKMTGIAALIFNVVLIGILAWVVSSADGELRYALDRAANWISLVGSLIPGLLIMNFLSELGELETNKGNEPVRKSAESLYGLAGMVVLSVTITFGVLLAHDTNQTLFWKGKNNEKTTAFARLCETRSFTDGNGKTLSYLLMKPLDYDATKKYPLVVALPYGGYEAPPALELAGDAIRAKHPAFIFVPRCPPGEGWGGIPNYPTIDTLVFEAILDMEKSFSIDPDRRYVTGVSRGGYGSWHFISTRPDMFAAAVPVCGGGDPSRAANAVEVSVWAFHGANDKNVPVKGSREMIAAIKQAGGDPQYTEYENEAHNIWHRVSQTSGLWDWLFEQKKN